jgi:hypothetical protein
MNAVQWKISVIDRHSNLNTLNNLSHYNTAGAGRTNRFFFFIQNFFPNFFLPAPEFSQCPKCDRGARGSRRDCSKSLKQLIAIIHILTSCVAFVGYIHTYVRMYVPYFWAVRYLTCGSQANLSHLLSFSARSIVG